MKYHIEKQQGQPTYLQLYRLIRDDIVNGIYPWGTKLPSKRLVASECGISTITVEHSYALLCDEGYAEARERSGYFVTFRSADGFLLPQSSTCKSIPIEPQLDVTIDFPFSVLAKTMRSVISSYDVSILDRSPNLGSPALRNAIAQYLARSRGVYAEPEQIVIGSGSEYLYGMIVELLGREKRFAIESPSYQRIEEVYRTTGIEPTKLPLGMDGIESSALQSCESDVLHITPYRSFPTGVTASASKRHEYLTWAAECNRFLIEDDFESEFSVSSKPEDTLFSHTQRDNVIYMNTFSKTISPSLRVAYMVLPKQLTDVYADKLGFYACPVPTYIQYVLTELIAGGDFERHINRVRRAKRKELQSK